MSWDYLKWLDQELMLAFSLTKAQKLLHQTEIALSLQRLYGQLLRWRIRWNFIKKKKNILTAKMDTDAGMRGIKYKPNSKYKIVMIKIFTVS